MTWRNTRRTLIAITLVGLAASLAAQEPAGDTVGTVSFRTVSNSAWRIAEIEGDGASRQSGTNAMILEVGGRYVFDLSAVDSDLFPMELRDGSGAVIASQRGQEVSEEFADADISVNAEEIRFTLTEELASRLSFYRAATYPSMIGVIRPYSPEPAETTEETTEETDQSNSDSTESSESG
jgi:hypothetical protein